VKIGARAKRASNSNVRIGSISAPARCRRDPSRIRIDPKADLGAKLRQYFALSPRCQNHHRIRIKDLAAVATRLRDAEAAVIDMLVEHCSDLDVIAGVGKRAFQQIAHRVAQLVLRFLRRRQLDFRKQALLFG